MLPDEWELGASCVSCTLRKSLTIQWDVDMYENIFLMELYVLVLLTYVLVDGRGDHDCRLMNRSYIALTSEWV